MKKEKEKNVLGAQTGSEQHFDVYAIGVWPIYFLFSGTGSGHRHVVYSPRI